MHHFDSDGGGGSKCLNHTILGLKNIFERYIGNVKNDYLCLLMKYAKRKGGLVYKSVAVYIPSKLMTRLQKHVWRSKLGKQTWYYNY